jgi:tyrosyl-tRNA synthetase
MSLSDETMWLYLNLISFRSILEIQQYRDEVSSGKNPRDIKFLLAEEIVERFHNRDAAIQARENFIAQFQKGGIPEDILEIQVHAGSIANIIKTAGLTQSTSEALRMIDQGAVKIDGERVNERNLVLERGKTVILQVGKRRFAKIEIT